MMGTSRVTCDGGAQARSSWYSRVSSQDRRRALELLAASPEGCTEALMFANGFTAELLVELVRAGLASAHAERMVAGGKMMEATRVKISEAGWQALAGEAVNGRAKST